VQLPNAVRFLHNRRRYRQHVPANKRRTPLPGAHIKVDGKLFIGIPEGCSSPLILVDEKTRSDVIHTNGCSLNACEFATKNSQEIAA
jgi:hypothetical protein